MNQYYKLKAYQCTKLKNIEKKDFFYFFLFQNPKTYQKISKNLKFIKKNVSDKSLKYIFCQFKKILFFHSQKMLVYFCIFRNIIIDQNYQNPGDVVGA